MSLRCAAWARDAEVDPAGTAPTCELFVLVEHPLPWPHDIGDDPHLAALEQVAARAAGGRKVRLQALVCEPEAATRRVIVFAAGPPPFRGYGRLEGSGAPDELADVVESLVSAEPPAPVAGVTDVLVCTHGSRDSCCGSLGTRLWRDAGECDAAECDPVVDLDDVRVWRTSHTGGHRFAPTAVTFPDGNYWAHLDPTLLAGVVERTASAEEAAAHLRGCAAFTPAVQVADRAGFAQQGWDWLEGGRFGDERSPLRVELCFESPDGTRGTYDVRLAEGRRMPIPDCGGDPEAAKKSQTELRVVGLQRWT